MKTRAWVQRGVRELSLEDLPIPDRLRDDEALARVDGCGLCGTDYEQYVGHLGPGVVDLPVIPGHEPVVTIERIGEAAQARWGVRPGSRVAVSAHAGCGVCSSCGAGEFSLCVSPAKIRYGYTRLGGERDLRGGMAEHMVLGGNTLLFPVPDGLSTNDALLFNPLGAGFDWALERGRVRAGDAVLIIAAGQRGLACAAAAAMAGAERIVVAGLPSDSYKLELALRLGATETVVIDTANPNSLVDQLGINSFDCAIDVAPLATRPILDAIATVRRGGRVVLAGLKGREVPAMPTDEIVLKGLTVVGARSVGQNAFRLALLALEQGRVNAEAWHSHTYAFAEAETAVRVQGKEIDTGVEPLHVSILASQ